MTELTNVQSKKFMILGLGADHYAVTLSCVREVLGLGQLTELPNMPPYYSGLINLRGKLVSAIDLHTALGVRKEAAGIKPRKKSIVITEVDTILFGAVVDQIVEVIAVPDSNVETTAVGGNKYFSGIIRMSEKPLAPILNLREALHVDELLAIQNASAKAA